MPVYEQGFEIWRGHFKARLFRWMVISRQGIVLAWQNKLLKRLLIIAWLPLLFYGGAFFILGYSTELKETYWWLEDFLEILLGSELTSIVLEEPSKARPLVWSLLFYFFFYYTQSFLVMLIVALVGPKLISDDLRCNALPIYFSKPITKLDYLLGKFGVIAFYIGMVTFVPAFVLYLVSILFSPSLTVITQTWSIVPKIFFSSVVIIIPCGAIMLALSSLTRNSRFLGIGWVLFWFITSIVSSFFNKPIDRSDYIRSINGHPPEIEVRESTQRWSELICFRRNLLSLNFEIFGIDKKIKSLLPNAPGLFGLLSKIKYYHHWGYSALILVGLTGFSLFILYQRIRFPEYL